MIGLGCFVIVAVFWSEITLNRVFGVKSIITLKKNKNAKLPPLRQKYAYSCVFVGRAVGNIVIHFGRICDVAQSKIGVRDGR